VEAEVALVGRRESIKDAVATALVEEGLVAGEDVAGAKIGGGELGEEAVGAYEGLDGRH